MSIFHGYQKDSLILYKDTVIYKYESDTLNNKITVWNILDGNSCVATYLLKDSLIVKCHKFLKRKGTIKSNLTIYKYNDGRQLTKIKESHKKTIAIIPFVEIKKNNTNRAMFFYGTKAEHKLTNSLIISEFLVEDYELPLFFEGKIGQVPDRAIISCILHKKGLILNHSIQPNEIKMEERNTAIEYNYTYSTENWKFYSRNCFDNGTIKYDLHLK